MKKQLKYIAITLVFLYGISWIFHLLFQSSLFPNPNSILITMIKLGPQLLTHLFASAYRIVISMTIALILGVVIGLCMGMYPPVGRVLSPLVYTLYPVPKIAFLPVFMLIFGLHDLSKIVLIISIIIFQYILSTIDAINQIDTSMIRSMKLMKLTRIQSIRYVYLPAIMPNILTATRNAFGMSLAVLFFSENYATKLGLGYAIMNYWSMVQYVNMYAGIVVLSLFGLLVFLVLDFIEEKFILKYK